MPVPRLFLMPVYHCILSIDFRPAFNLLSDQAIVDLNIVLSPERRRIDPRVNQAAYPVHTVWLVVRIRHAEPCR